MEKNTHKYDYVKMNKHVIHFTTVNRSYLQKTTPYVLISEFLIGS